MATNRTSILRRRRAVVALIALIAAVVAGCGVSTSPDRSSDGIVVGASSDPTMTMAAYLYRAALVANGTAVAPGVAVADNAGQLGAMTRAERDLFPTFSGELLAALVPASSVAPSSSPTSIPAVDEAYDQTYVSLNRALPQGVALADPTTVMRSALASAAPKPTESGASEQLVAVYRSAAFDREQIKTINKVAGELTAEDLRSLTSDAASSKDPETVAMQWVVTHGLNH